MTVADRLKTALADRYLHERELGEGGMSGRLEHFGHRAVGYLQAPPP